LSPPYPDNLAEDNDLQGAISENCENDPPEPVVGSVNFDTSLEAALFYVEDGWAVVACCQFDPATGRCTGPEKHHHEEECRGAPCDCEPCKGKRPLIAGRKEDKGKGLGYTAASRDKGLIRDWFARQFPDAGIAIRLDRINRDEDGDGKTITCALLDYDVKDGAPGLETRQFLHDTFDLPTTLTALTPSGGIHDIYALPDDLPADYLGSWTRILDDAELGGLDLKVGVKGLAHVEPTIGKTGVYRWIDPTVEPAMLPRVVCDYLHEIHERRNRAPQEQAAQAEAQPFDPAEDQARYFKDVEPGERRPRLRSIACRLAAGGATQKQIVEVLKYHDKRFTKPTNDAGYIARVAAGAVSKFALEVTQ
jgi:hypothetical protein